jgi:hypothetical protein
MQKTFSTASSIASFWLRAEDFRSSPMSGHARRPSVCLKGAKPEVGGPRENHRQAVRQEWPILIHTASAALLWPGAFHPSIIKASCPAGVSGVGSCTGSRSSADAKPTDAVPATKVLRSIIMPLPLPDFSIDVFCSADNENAEVWPHRLVATDRSSKAAAASSAEVAMLWACSSARSVGRLSALIRAN